MNDLTLFLNTKIANTGILSAVGNVLLAPIRLFCSGKTVAFREKNQFIRVSTFNLGAAGYEFGPYTVKLSKQEVTPRLQSSPWGLGVDMILAPIFMMAVFIPCLCLGSILKALSFIFLIYVKHIKKRKISLLPKTKHLVVKKIISNMRR